MNLCEKSNLHIWEIKNAAVLVKSKSQWKSNAGLDSAPLDNCLFGNKHCSLGLREREIKEWTLRERERESDKGMDIVRVVLCPFV